LFFVEFERDEQFDRPSSRFIILDHL